MSRTSYKALLLGLALPASCGQRSGSGPASSTASAAESAATSVVSAHDSTRRSNDTVSRESASTKHETGTVSDTSTQRPASARTQRDSVRGTISLEGTGEAPVAMLVTKEGRMLSVTGPYTTDLLRQLDGVEIVAFGRRRRRADDPVEIETFSVRGYGGNPARDGILRRTPSGDVLELADGRRLALPRLPEYLASANGKRIWIAGPLDAPTGASAIDPDWRFGRPRRMPEVRP